MVSIDLLQPFRDYVYTHGLRTLRLIFIKIENKSDPMQNITLTLRNLSRLYVLHAQSFMSIRSALMVPTVS